MYFNECMNGFEYQVAGHMIWEGMVLEGLAIARPIPLDAPVTSATLHRATWVFSVLVPMAGPMFRRLIRNSR